MPRKLRLPKIRTSSPRLSAIEEYVLLHGELPDRDACGSYGVSGNPWATLSLLYPTDDDHVRDMWTAAVAEGVLDAWIAEHPGTRPYGWWLVEAPRALVEGRSTPNPEPRRHVSGCGRPVVEDVYPAWLARRHGVLPFADVDANDPPRVESEAAYLARQGYLTTAEHRRVPVEAFAPEVADHDDDEA